MESPENGYINYAYLQTAFGLGNNKVYVVRLQMHLYIYEKQHFEKTICASRRM